MSLRDDWNACRWGGKGRTVEDAGPYGCNVDARSLQYIIGGSEAASLHYSLFPLGEAGWEDGTVAP